MHKKTHAIIKNLGYSDDVVKEFKIKDPKILNSSLKKLGMPETAVKQIKILENLEDLNTGVVSNLIENLIKHCRRSLDAFAQKNIAAKIVFKNNNWTIYSEKYNKAIQKLQEVCKMHFDELSSKNLEVTLIFDGTSTWKAIAPNES